MSKTRRTARRSNNVYELKNINEALFANGKAQEEGPRKKRWTQHDLKAVKPLTDNQRKMFNDFSNGQHIIGMGSAGTGKTYVATYLALNALLDPESPYERIIIVRSAVPTRDVGFLPGTLEEKSAIYELPYKDIFGDLCQRASTYADMKEAGLVEFCTTSFVRGLTWDKAIVIVDECQNATFHELNSIITRLGKESTVLLVGDFKQTDLTKHSDMCGIDMFVGIAKTMHSFGITEFTTADIVRSTFVKEWIKACERLNVK
jgi:phosphate starvation-inducible protein PhoH